MGRGSSKPSAQEPALPCKTLENSTSLTSTLMTRDNLTPEVSQLKALVEGDPDLSNLFEQMFSQIPNNPPFTKDPSGATQIRSFSDLIRELDKIIQRSPGFAVSATEGFHPGLPLRTTLTWPMGTEAGVKAFSDRRVNDAFKAILKKWAYYLGSPESRGSLNGDKGGWFSEAALEALTADFPGRNFEEIFVCDSTNEFWGYGSFDNFLTREIRGGVRDVENSDRDDVVGGPCEGQFQHAASDVQKEDKFTLKEQPYSLQDMLNNGQYVEQFINGSVYQMNLSSTQYHRWCSPVTGIIRDIVDIPGNYFTQCPAVGFDAETPLGSAHYMSHVATRIAIYIEADNPKIGLCVFLAVGLCEMSSCEATVNAGQRVRRGDELGMFHYGGSTCCMVFRPETKLDWFDDPKKGSLVKVRSAIGGIL